jgi:hypothetical protein
MVHWWLLVHSGHKQLVTQALLSYRSTLAALALIILFSRNVKVSKKIKTFVNEIEESFKIF